MNEVNEKIIEILDRQYEYIEGMAINNPINLELKEKFDDVIKDMKLSAEEDYIFIKNLYNGEQIVYSVTPYGIKYITMPVNTDYTFIYADVIRLKAFAHEIVSSLFCYNPTDGSKIEMTPSIGVAPADNAITKYTMSNRHYQSDKLLNDVLNNIKNCNSMKTIEFEKGSEFHNKVMGLSSSDGAVPFNIDEKHCIIIAPTILPMSKSNSVTLNIMDFDDYFTCEFIIHKKSRDVTLMMNFLYV